MFGFFYLLLSDLVVYSLLFAFMIIGKLSNVDLSGDLTRAGAGPTTP